MSYDEIYDALTNPLLNQSDSTNLTPLISIHFHPLSIRAAVGVDSQPIHIPVCLSSCRSPSSSPAYSWIFVFWDMNSLPWFFPFPSMHYVCLSSWPSSSVAPTPCHDPARTLFLVNYGPCIPHEYFQVLCTTFMCLLLFKKVWSCLSCFPPHTYASEPFFFFHGNCLFHLFIYFSAFAFLVSSSFRALHRSFLHGA